MDLRGRSARPTRSYSEIIVRRPACHKVVKYPINRWRVISHSTVAAKHAVIAWCIEMSTYGMDL